MKKQTFRSKLLLAMIGLSSLGVISQNQGSNWHFGNQAGLTFNSGSPVAISSSYIGTYSGTGSSNEGVASISNASGITLFYTDGQTVYNSAHVAMANGSGLSGNSSSTQSGIIIPKPGSSSQYFVFTVDAVSGPGKIKYNIVDMSLNSGLGDIVALKKNLNMPYGITAPNTFAEKLTAVPKASGIGFWLIAHVSNETSGSGTFVVWEIGCGTSNDGINEFLVSGARQTVGSVSTSVYANELGYMKISPNFQKLAYGCSGGNFAEVFNFNNATGIISNPKKVTTTTLGSGCLPYGIEFSPNSQYLYVGDLYHGPKIIRYDLTQSVLDIPASCVVFDASYVTSGSVLTASGSQSGGWDYYYTLGALQYAPDGNIYGALPGKDHLLKITNPNATSPTIMEAGFTFTGTKYSALGLPNFVTSFLGNAWISITGAPCSYTINYAGASNLPNATYLWSFGDGTTSTLQSPTHAYSSSGTYYINLTVTDPASGCSATAQQTLQTTGCGCQASMDPLYTKFLTPTTISTNTFWDDKIYIGDNVIITVDNAATLDITNVDVVFGHGAGIDFKNGATLRANNSVFRPCTFNEVWRGIDFYTSNSTSPTGTINECTFKNAKTAIEAYSSGTKMTLDMRITNNLFADCQRGIALSNISFIRSMTGNTYMVDNKNLPFNLVASQLNSAASTEFNGIYSTSNDYADLISQNDFIFTSNNSISNARVCAIYTNSDNNLSLSDNKFTDFSIGIYGNYNTNASIENNTFTWSHLFNMASAPGNKVQILLNYAQNALIKGNKIYNSNSMNSLAGTLPNANLAIANIGIASNGSKYVTVSQNEVNGCEIGMSFNGIFNQSNKFLFVTENTINKSWFYGIYCAAYNAVDISCNKVDMELNTSRDATGIVYNNSLMGSGFLSGYLNAQDVAIRSNCVLNSKNGIYCFNQNSGVSVPLPEVYNNFVYNYRQYGFENNSFSAVASTSPREVYHNTFISNNSLSGTVDVNTDASHIINLEANFGIQNSNSNVTMLLANTKSSTASCAMQVGSFQNNLSDFRGSQLCNYYFTGINSNTWTPVAKMIPMNVYPSSDSTEFNYDGINFLDPIHTTGIEIVNYKDELFTVYPNPAKDKINVRYNVEEANGAYIEFIDVQGKVLKNQALTHEMIDMEINISDLPSGFYILRMTNAEKSIHYSKLVKN